MFLKYIDPTNSARCNNTNINIFPMLEDNIARCIEIGNVIAVGDFITHTGTGCDLVGNYLNSHPIFYQML